MTLCAGSPNSRPTIAARLSHQPAVQLLRPADDLRRWGQVSLRQSVYIDESALDKVLQPRLQFLSDTAAVTGKSKIVAISPPGRW